MQEAEYTKLLLESAFKESERFWTRNNVFLIIHALLLGFVFNSISQGIRPNMVLVLLFISFIGIIISLLHFSILIASEHYNKTWLKSLINYVDKKAKDPLTYNLDIWQHFLGHFKDHENKLPWPHWPSTKIARIASIIFLLVWIAIFFLAVFRLLPEYSQHLKDNITIL